MTQNFLLLNSDKTDVVLFGPERFREKLFSYIVTLDGISLAFSSTARNLGVISDQDLSFDSHIKQVSGAGVPKAPGLYLYHIFQPQADISSYMNKTAATQNRNLLFELGQNRKSSVKTSSCHQ